MYCQKCGTKLNDGMRFCPKCGTSVPEIKYENTGVISQNSVIEERKVEQSSVAGSNSTQFKDFSSIYDQDIKMPEAAALPMKWYKFLIYFALFAAPILLIINSINWFNSLMLDGKVYILTVIRYPFYLKVLMVIYIILCLLLAAFSIYTRQMLAKFKKKAPYYLYALYLGNYAPLLILLIMKIPEIPFMWQQLVMQSENYIAALIGFILGIILLFGFSLIMLWINYKYFTKRKHLFVN